MDRGGTSCGGFTIRNAAAQDARAIAVIQVEASRAAYGAVTPPGYFDGFTVSSRVSAWSEMIANQSDIDHIIVSGENGDVRGYAHFGQSRDPKALPRVGELYSLYVAPLHWRRSFGKRLLAASLHGLAHMKFESATLWVLAFNRPARAFYERFGWRADGFEKADHAEMTEIRYRIHLAGAAVPPFDENHSGSAP